MYDIDSLSFYIDQGSGNAPMGLPARPLPTIICSSTRVNEFRAFLSQFSTSFHTILHTLFSIHVAIRPTLRCISTGISEVKPFDK